MITPDRPMTGEELREIRLRLGLTQEELASRLGYVSGNFISRLERGRAKVKPQTAMLARALSNVGPDLLDAAELSTEVDAVNVGM